MEKLDATIGQTLDGPVIVKVSFVGITLDWRTPRAPSEKSLSDSGPASIRITELSSQTGFDQLIAALEKAPTFETTEKNFWRGSAMFLRSMNLIVLEIVTAIVPMFRVQRNAKVTPREVLDADVWDSLQANMHLPQSQISTGTFSWREYRVCWNKKYWTSPVRRIGDVKFEVERNFCKVRVLTDLRPAFWGRCRRNSDMNFAVIHNFQIGYHDGMGKHHEFYLSLDAGDLEKLKVAITRAEKKAAALERLAEKAGVQPAQVILWPTFNSRKAHTSARRSGLIQTDTIYWMKWRTGTRRST